MAGTGPRNYQRGGAQSSTSTAKGDLEFGWQRSLPILHQGFRSKHAERVQEIASEQERVNAELWGESRNCRKRQACRKDSDSGSEQFEWWYPDVPVEAQETKSSGKSHAYDAEAIEREIVNKKRWGSVAGKAAKIASARKQNALLQDAANKAKHFVLYAKSEQRIEMMQTAIERYEDLTNSARYNYIVKTLEEPDKAIAPLYEIFDTDCIDTFTALQDQLQPMAHEAKRRANETKDLRKDEDENTLQDIYLKQSHETHKELQAASKKMLGLGAGTLETAVKVGLEEFVETTNNIRSLEKENQQRAIIYNEHWDKMGELKRREAHIGGIINEVEGRARQAEQEQQDKVEKLKNDLMWVQRQMSGMEKQCRDELDRVKGAFNHIEQKMLDVLLKNVPRMLQMRLERSRLELRFQEKAVECRKEQLRKMCAKLRKAIARAEIKLHDALEVNQLFELRHCALEGEALHIELDLRSRELVDANGISGLHINPNVEMGLCTVLLGELSTQLQWFAERSHHFELDRNTLSLTRKPPITTPYMLLTCSRDLLESFKQQRIHKAAKAAARAAAQRDGQASWDSMQSQLEADANSSNNSPGAKRRRKRLTAEDPGRTRFGSNNSDSNSSSATAADAQCSELGPDDSASRPSESNEASNVKGELASDANAEESSDAAPLFEIDPDRQICYEPVLGLDTSAAPEDHVREQEAYDATRKAFKSNAADLIMEAILKRPGSNDKFRHHFLKELRFLPATGAVVDQIDFFWSKLQDTISEPPPSVSNLQASFDQSLTDLKNARLVADMCSFWVTEGAKYAGIFSDALVMDLVWLSRFCDRIAERAGLLRGIVFGLEEAQEKKASRMNRVADAANKLLKMSKPLLSGEMVKAAENWMLRIVKVLHDQRLAKLACHSALRWYCGKFYGQGQADLDSIVRGVEVMERMYNAPQLQQSPAAQRLIAGEVDAEIRYALEQVLKKTESEAYESALLVFDVIVNCSAGEVVGATFDPVDEETYAESDGPRMSQGGMSHGGMSHGGTSLGTDQTSQVGASQKDSDKDSNSDASSIDMLDAFLADLEHAKTEELEVGGTAVADAAESPLLPGDGNKSPKSPHPRLHYDGTEWGPDEEALLGDELYDEELGEFVGGDVIEDEDGEKHVVLYRNDQFSIDFDVDSKATTPEGESDDDGETGGAWTPRRIEAELEECKYKQEAMRESLNTMDRDALRWRAIELDVSEEELERIDALIDADPDSSLDSLIELLVQSAVPPVVVPEASPKRAHLTKPPPGSPRPGEVIEDGPRDGRSSPLELRFLTRENMQHVVEAADAWSVHSSSQGGSALGASPDSAKSHPVGSPELVGEMMSSQIGELLPLHCQRKAAKQLARLVIDDALSHAAYSKHPNWDYQDSGSDCSSHHVDGRHSIHDGKKYTRGVSFKDRHPEFHDYKERLAEDAEAVYKKRSANWHLCDEDDPGDQAQAISHGFGRRAKSHAMRRQSTRQSGFEIHGRHGSIAGGEFGFDTDELFPAIMGQHIDRCERKAIRKLKSRGSEIGDTSTEAPEEEDEDQEEPEPVHPEVDHEQFMKTLLALKAWFKVCGDQQSVGTGKKWIDYGLKYKLAKARAALQLVDQNFRKTMLSLNAAGMREDDPLLIYGMKLLEEEDIDQFMQYWKILQSMISKRADPRITQSVMVAYDNEIARIQDARFDSVRHGNDKDSKSFDNHSVSTPRTPELPPLTSTSQERSSPVQVIPLLDSTAPSGQIKRKPESCQADIAEARAAHRKAQLALVSEREASVQEAVAECGRGPVVEKPSSTVAEWAEQCALSAQSSAPWLQKMRADHASLKPVSESSPVKAKDLKRLPGLQTCLFESPKSSLPSKPAGWTAPASTPRTARTDHVEVSDLLPISPLEVSTVLQSGQMCGAPGTRIQCLGRDVAAGEGSGMPGWVLAAKPKLARRLNEPLVSIERPSTCGGRTIDDFSIRRPATSSGSSAYLPQRRRRQLYQQVAATPSL